MELTETALVADTLPITHSSAVKMDESFMVARSQGKQETATEKKQQDDRDNLMAVAPSIADDPMENLQCSTEEWAPPPMFFHNTNELGSVRHECEMQSVMTS